VSSRLVIRILGAAAGIAALALAWFLLAPPGLGGKTSFVITSGTSMQPKIHQGDLVLARQRASYGVGDVILFHSPTLHRHVLHRIVAFDGDRFVTKGDNNDYRDPQPVPASRVQGEAVLLLPGVGRPITWLRSPLNAAVILFLVVFLSLAGGREVARRRTRPAVRPLQPTAGAEAAGALTTEAVAVAARTALVGGSVALGLFALLAVLAWRAPENRAQPAGQAYEHTGSFSYSADVPRSTVYPDGRLETGDAAFTKLVRRLDVSFTYRFETTRPNDVRGGIALDAVISDGSGWARTVPIDSAAPFDGETARAEGVLDLRRLEALGARMRTLTGSSATTFTVTLQPRVQVSGYAGEAVVDEAFTPELPLVLDAVSLRPESGDGLEASLLPREPGSVVEQRPNRLGVGPVALPVDQARALSGLGIGLALLVVLGAAVLLARHRPGPEAERIAARYGGRIVSASTVIPEGRWVTDVSDIESLVRLADHYDRVVLHTTTGTRDAYLVDDGVAVYRYRPGPDEASASSASPLPGRC
jgi:signal peptidase I